MDVSADDSVAMFAAGQIGEHTLETGYEGYRFLDLVLDGLGHRKIRFPPPGSHPVVEIVEFQKSRIAYVSEFGQPFHFRGDAVENVAMRDEEPVSFGLEDIVSQETDVGQIDRNKIVKEIVMVASQVNHFCVVVLHHFHDDFKKVRVFRFPFADAGFLQMPSVYDVTVQNQSSAVYSTKKITDLVYFRMGSSQMNVRHHNGPVIRSFFHASCFS